MSEIGKIDTQKEYDDVVESVSKKYKYSEELKAVLKRIVPAMLYDASYDEKVLFYRMLQRTPIAVIDEESDITVDELESKYLGDIKDHIVEESNLEESEYDKIPSVAAFVTEVDLDDNLGLKGNKQFIYVKKLDENKFLTDTLKKRIELLGSSIMVDHLIHELGHAWASEMNPYVINKQGQLEQRVGALVNKYELEKLPDGKILRRQISQDGLITEEGLNTLMQEKSMARYLGIDIEHLRKYYSENILINSNYQGAISYMVGHFVEKMHKKDIRSFRMFGDQDSLRKLNITMSKASIYQTRAEESDVDREKKEAFSKVDSKKAQELFAERKNDFFPNRTMMTPMQMLENSLVQVYNITTNKMKFPIFDDGGLEQYSDVMKAVLGQGYILINQSAKVLEEQKLGNNEQKKE